MSESIIKDFDKILPPKRIAKLAGENIDVSWIPSRTSRDGSRRTRPSKRLALIRASKIIKASPMTKLTRNTAKAKNANNR